MQNIVKDKDNKEIKLYNSLKTARLLECKIFVDNKLEYEGNIDDLPKDMKNYKYHGVIVNGGITEFYISSEYNNLK